MALWLELLVVPASAQQPITKSPRILVKNFDATEVAGTNRVSWSIRQAKGRYFAGVNVLSSVLATGKQQTRPETVVEQAQRLASVPGT